MARRDEVKLGRLPFNGYGVPYHQAFGYREIPGAGANQFAWETYALPVYTPIGWGVSNKQTRQHTASAPPVWQRQGITLTTLGSPGNLTGSFNSGPLINTATEGGGQGGTLAWQRPDQFILGHGRA